MTDTSPSPSTPIRRRPRWLLPAAAAAVLLAGAAAVYISARDDNPASSSAKPSSSAPAARMVVGTLTLQDSDGFSFTSESGCAGTGGYDDIRSGTQVVITDASGATVGLGRLGQGKLDGTVKSFTADLCQFDFIVRDVPTGKGFYGVEVAHRGRVQYPEQQLFGALALTLG